MTARSFASIGPAAAIAALGGLAILAPPPPRWPAMGPTATTTATESEATVKISHLCREIEIKIKIKIKIIF